jgi:hypothetical protein
MFRPGKRTFSGLAIGMLALVGLARSDDPKPVPDLIPVAYDEPERLPYPMPVNSEATASIILDWAGPETVSTNRPNPFTLTVRNTIAQSAHRVVVQVRVPDHVTATDVEPAAKCDKGVLLWDFGTMQGKEARTIRMNLTTSVKQDLTCQAWVTMTGTAGMRVAVREPKLEATIVAPKEVVLGDVIPVTYLVKNSGDAVVEKDWTMAIKSSDAEDVDVTCQKELLAGGTSERKKSMVARQPGTMTYTVTVMGDGGARSTAVATVKVLEPKLAVNVVGPKERLVGSKATYAVTVENVGAVPVSFEIAEVVPTSFKIVSCSKDALYSMGMIAWRPVGALAVGEKKVITYDMIAVSPGSAELQFIARGSRNTKAEATARTVVEGIPAMRMEVSDAADPVELNGETTYEIKLMNTGTKADSQLRLECVLPKELTFVSASGPTDYLEKIGIDFNRKDPANCSTIVFEPISELAPKTEAVFRVKVKAKTAGDVRFKAVLTSMHLATPVTKEESTRVYGE